MLADIPGLVQGAHQGTGLGLRFLRHIERTKVIVFILEDRRILDPAAPAPASDLQLLRSELEAYNPDLLRRPFIVVLNKSDLLTEAQEEENRCLLPGEPLYVVSTRTRKGLDAVLEVLWQKLRRKVPTEAPPG